MSRSGWGALLDRFISCGIDVSALCFTHGEASTLYSRPGDLAVVHATELRVASQARHRSGGTARLDQAAISELAAHVTRLIDDVRPSHLLTFDDGGVPGHVPSGTLSEAQKATLASMAQEEKLAGDLYQAFADRYPAVVFDRIAAAEDQHLDAVRTLLARYGLSDPTAGKPAGQFSDATVQATYDRLLAEGSATQSAAISLGLQVERTDIADLQQALRGLSAAEVTQVYQHLTAFTTWATR